MNTRRVAALLRELADEIERDDAPAANDAKPPTRRRATPPPPRSDIPETAKAEAQRALRRLGLLGSKR